MIYDFLHPLDRFVSHGTHGALFAGMNENAAGHFFGLPRTVFYLLDAIND